MKTQLHRSFLLILLAAGPVMLAVIPSSAQEFRIQTDYVPTGSHRLGQVAYLGTRQEIMETRPMIGVIAASGVDTTLLRDGSVIGAVIYCCGGPNEEETARIVYVPAEIEVALGDIVEYRVGHPPDEKEIGALNIVVRIREKGADFGNHCRWDPPDDRLWHRILYCDWMDAEGWIKKGGIMSAWYKPPTDES
jgi:hypothetical protein